MSSTLSERRLDHPHRASSLLHSLDSSSSSHRSLRTREATPTTEDSSSSSTTTASYSPVHSTSSLSTLPDHDSTKRMTSTLRRPKSSLQTDQSLSTQSSTFRSLEGGFHTLLDTKWDIALFSVAIFFAFNLVVVLVWWRLRVSRHREVFQAQDAIEGKNSSPKEMTKQKHRSNNNEQLDDFKDHPLSGTKEPTKQQSQQQPKQQPQHHPLSSMFSNRGPIGIVPVISFAARSHLETSSSDEEGGDSPSIVSSMYDTTSQKWDESYFTHHGSHGANANGGGAGPGGSPNNTGVVKETIDGILGSRFFPYNAPVTPRLPKSSNHPISNAKDNLPTTTTNANDHAQQQGGDDGGKRISGSSGGISVDTSTTNEESASGLSFPASTNSFEI